MNLTFYNSNLSALDVDFHLGHQTGKDWKILAFTVLKFFPWVGN